MKTMSNNGSSALSHGASVSSPPAQTEPKAPPTTESKASAAAKGDEDDDLMGKTTTKRRVVLLVLCLVGIAAVLATALSTILTGRRRPLDKEKNAQQNPTPDDEKENQPTFRPHILFIILDDLGSHDLGMHGTGIHTPACDELAQNGVYLSNYYVHPSCSPTRCAILSGRYPSNTGIHYAIDPHSTQGLPLDEETLPQVLKKVGYRRHAVGKWHAGHSSWEQTPTFRGFESFFGFYLGGGGYYTHVNWKNGYDLRYDKQEECGANCSQLVEERGIYSTHLFTREAIRIIESHKADMNNNNTSPLFLWLAYQAVHGPKQVPDEYKDRYEINETFSKKRQTYAGMLTAADEGILNVTNALKETGLWEDTLVVVTTDNGGPTTVCAVQGSSNYPLRGGKCSVWQGGTTGDGFLAGPAALAKLGIPTGKRMSSLFHVVDWLPTLANITGAEPDGKPLDGVNQLQTLRGGKAARKQLFVGLAYQPGKKAWHGPAIRVRRWKLIENSGGPDSGQIQNEDNTTLTLNGTKYMLFNLKKDKEETQNVAWQRPKKVKKLAAMIQMYKIYIQQENPSCPYPGSVETEFGPTAMPWCDESNRLLFYT